MTCRNSTAEDIVAQARRQGWRVRKGGHGFRAQCPHECMCQVSIAKSPGSMRYFANVAAKLRRCTGWNRQ